MVKRNGRKWLRAEQGAREVFKPWWTLPRLKLSRVAAYRSKAGKLKNCK